MSADEPRIERVARIELKVEPYAWPFLSEYGDKIDAHWHDLTARKPRLFNGRVMLMHSCRVETESEPVLRGIAFETDYKAFLAWRTFGFPDKSITNCFAMTALRSADGAYMLGRMGVHTSAAGRLYFPAGTPDLKDVKNGEVDLAHSALRELTEETGILASDLTLAPDWTLVFHGGYLACMRAAQSKLDAASLVAACAAFLAREAEPELDGLVPIFSEADFDEQMPLFMRHYLLHRFEERA